MAFPGTFNISYYKGDTYEFRVYPKDSNGNPFDLSDYDNQDISFTIATARGAGATQYSAYAIKSTDGAYIRCAILPAAGNALNQGSQYVYDIEVKNTDDPSFPLVYTLLTGTINVTEQVTGAAL
jgi:hypothetical protein